MTPRRFSYPFNGQKNPQTDTIKVCHLQPLALIKSSPLQLPLQRKESVAAPTSFVVQ